MSKTNETPITVSNDKYYKIHDKPTLYDIRFPLAWAIAVHTQPPKQYYNYGPAWCWECRDKCTLNGVFVGFCNYCAVERLDGYYGAGTETPLSNLSKEEIWRIYPYMHGTSISDIGISQTEEKDDNFAPFQSREHMEVYDLAERTRLSLDQEQEQDKYQEHALLVSMCRSVLDNNRAPMGQKMSWAEYREYLDNKWWDEC